MRFLSITLSLLFVAAGCGTPSLLITPVANTNRLDEVQVQPGKGWFPGKIAIIEVEGMLMNARTGGFLQPSENKLSLFVEQLEEAASDPAVKAVVLRVNSPGGTVTASDTMYEALVKFKKHTKKPVIASTQDVAASGAYYVCCAADAIVAHPTSVIGSIGVIFQTFDVEGTMAKIGLRAEAIKSGPLKDMASPFHGLTPEERQVMQGMVDEYHKRFVTVVTTHRPVLAEQKGRLQTATDGRVFSGTQAVELGLADRTGLLDDAIELARHKAAAPGAKVIMYKRPFGYTGSIYATGDVPAPRAAAAATPGAQTNVIHLDLPDTRALLPTGFYYLWQPGR